MKETFWGLLSLFGGEAEGEEESMPVHTPQAETGESKTPLAAGEEEKKEGRQEAFRTLMEGEYKDLFTAYFQETFNRRFKEQKEMKEALERARLTVKEAAAYFGVEEGALSAAIRAETEKKNAPSATAAEPPTPIAVPDQEAEEIRKKEREAAVAAACLATEQRLTAHIRARGLRPFEGAAQPSGKDGLQGVSRLSRAQRAELARRAANGERIKL